MNKMRTSQLIATFASALVLAACTSLPGPSTEQGIHDSLNAAAQTQKPPTPPEAVNQALLGANHNGRSQPKVKHFDVVVNNMPARTFFLGLVKGTPYNIVVPQHLKGRVSLQLKNVTVKQVMRVVRDSYGYNFRRHGNVFIVQPETLQTRIFQVNYLDITRDGQSRTRVTSSGTSAGRSNQRQGNYNGAQYSGGDNDKKRNSTLIHTQNESNFWHDLTASLKAIVGTKNGANVVVNSDSGVIVVRAMPGELHNVAMYLDQVQGIVSREVVIEARIIEVVLNNGFQAGINWSALGRPGAGKTVFGGQTGGGAVAGGGASNLNNLNLNFNGTLTGNGGVDLTANGTPFSQLPTSAFGGVFALALNLNDFSAFLELLQSQGDTHVLSSPRVATLNNQQAVIKVGSDEFFVTGIRSNTYMNTTTQRSSNVILQPFFSGIALDVTPQIDADNMVTLHIHPSISKVTDQKKTFIVGDKQTSLPLAHSSVRESDSVVRAKSGQIIVIGGLMKRQTKTVNYQTPILGDIPLLGALFRHSKKKNVKTELVILLKPIVINHAGQWAGMSQHALDRIDALNGH